MSALGLKVRELRVARGMTQIDLAVALDMSHTAVRAIEARGQEPGLRTLRKLRSLFGVTYDELINESDFVATIEALQEMIISTGVAAARGSTAAAVEQTRLIRQLQMLETDNRAAVERYLVGEIRNESAHGLARQAELFGANAATPASPTARKRAARGPRKR